MIKPSKLPNHPLMPWTGLVENDGTTRRGIVFLRFSMPHEGLAIAAALEDDALFNRRSRFRSANIRAGRALPERMRRWAGIWAFSSARLRSSDHPGYLQMGAVLRVGRVRSHSRNRVEFRCALQINSTTRFARETSNALMNGAVSCGTSLAHQVWIGSLDETPQRRISSTTSSPASLNSRRFAAQRRR
jgi:hypothetical protein